MWEVQRVHGRGRQCRVPPWNTHNAVCLNLFETAIAVLQELYDSRCASRY